MANRRIRSIDHSNQAKLPSITRKSTTSYSPVDSADKDITLHFPTFQRRETNHSRRNKAPPSFPAGKKSNQYFCLAFDNELPPIPQIVDKKCGISFKKVSGNQERKSTDKLDKQMHRSRYMLEKEATIFNQVTESSSTCDLFTSATSQSWPNVSTKQWPHMLWRAPCFWWKYRSATRIYRERCQMEGDFTGKVIEPEKTGNGDITL